MRYIPIIAAGAISLLTTAAIAQNADTSMKGNPGHAHGASTTGGTPKPVNPGDVRKSDTSMKGNPGHAHGASTTGGTPKPVDPAEVKRMDTRDPNSAR
ncbi:MAG: hypothetical protein K2Y27_18645 [Xanthobacteraceae bacterium]|nr:hypothetical protein [Xanthobacteraceae bacterium]